MFKLFFLCLLLCGCTTNFHNIFTHGTATDLLDEAVSPNNTVNPNLNVPLIP